MDGNGRKNSKTHKYERQNSYQKLKLSNSLKVQIQILLTCKHWSQKFNLEGLNVPVSFVGSETFFKTKKCIINNKFKMKKSEKHE